MKFLKTAKRIIIIIVIIFFPAFILSRGHVYSQDELEYGLTFSKKQAEDLGLDWQKTFIDILDDLKVRKIRLSAYWNEVEPELDNFYWQSLDWQVQEASKRNVEIILAIGSRLPRWPECHYPNWSYNISQDEKENEILNYITETINRYKENRNIVAWQIENEPFLSHFGYCPELNKDFLDSEISLARQLDNRPIVVTDSGELSFWIPAAIRADIFGTTMYKDTYSAHLKSYIHYPIKPGFFRFKKNITNLFASPQKWVVIELQAEPWGPVPYQNLTEEEKDETMNLQKFNEMIEFASETGFNEFYLWGAEWWYWEKEKNNNPDLWEEAKKLFNDNIKVYFR